MCADEIVEYFETFEPFTLLSSNIGFDNVYVIIHKDKDISFCSKFDKCD